MWGFQLDDQVEQHLQSNAAFATLLKELVGDDNFQRDGEEWAKLSIAQALKHFPVEDRNRLEDALNDGRIPPAKRTMTARQQQFVAEHSGEFRTDAARQAFGEKGREAMAQMAACNVAGARKVFAKSGLSKETIEVFLAGWDHHFMQHETDDGPTVCCVVNALPHMTYVGRVISANDQLVWQEIEPGQIVEHRREDLDQMPPFAPQDGKADPWLNSCCIAYREGKATVEAAQLLLLNSYSETPDKPFVGRIVSTTNKRYVQENGDARFSGHLKSLTGELEVGKSYELTYHGIAGEKSVTVMPDSRELVALGGEIFKRHHVVVSLTEMRDCMTDSRRNAGYSGRILEIDDANGLVVQSMGRGQATVHKLAHFPERPQLGEYADVHYREGGLSVHCPEPSQGISR